MNIKIITFILAVLVTAIFLSACAGVLQEEPQQDLEPPQVETIQPGAVQESENPPSYAFVDEVSQPGAQIDDLSNLNQNEIELLDPEEKPPLGAEREFTTDFNLHSVPYSEVVSGGPPKDGIPALNNPGFIGVNAADEWLEALEPVILLRIGAQARAYPVQILMYHEIVNDVVAGVPVVVSFCPLCNTAIAFERTVGGQVLDFGTTGRLRNSNLIMYDRQTETWWQQASGEAIAGELTGAQLEFRPASMISWQEFKTQFPHGQVLSKETGYQRPYGRNPYAGYDNINQSPFLFFGETPELLPPMARVLTVDAGVEAKAYPYDVLQELHVINDNLAGEHIVVIWESGTASPLDVNTVAEGRDVGTASAFSRVVNGEVLTFIYDNGKILDEQTGSQWNVLGKAQAGELASTELHPLVAINHFWFSWAAFKPETKVYQP